MLSPIRKPRRQRGVILTEFGRQRYHAAQRRLETAVLSGGRLSLERLSLEVGLSTKTISRVLGRDTPVDLRSLELLFASLDIDLQPSDFNRAQRDFDPQHGLPERRSAFFGRTVEIARLRKLLADRRAVTLTGAGGVGKTRLALEAVTRHSDDSFDRVAYCDLSVVNDPTLVVSAIVEAFGRQQDQRGLITISKIVEDSRTLLVLDNCEHVVARVATVIDDLLGEIKPLVVLATSREPLGIDGEAVVRVFPFPIPERAANAGAVHVLGCDAVALFVDRARCADDGFRFDDDAAVRAVEIVSRVEGMPLAIEIAAGQVATTELAEISESLRDHHCALLSESAAHGPRHRSARAIVDWSFELLDEKERRFFRRLAVFTGSFDAHAALCVVVDEPIDVRAVIGRLVRKSLLFVQSGSVPTRYRMLETVRQYAALKLDEHCEAAATRLRHAVYVHESLATFDLPFIAPNLGSINEALEWSTSQSHNLHIAAGICCNLFRFWDMRAELREGELWLRRVIDCDPDLSPATTRAQLHEGLALLLFRQGRLAASIEHAARSQSLYGETDDALGIVRVSALRGMAALDANDAASARRELEKALRDAALLGSVPQVVVALEGLGRLRAECDGDYQASLDLLQRSLTKARSIGMTGMVATALADISAVCAKLGRYEDALEYARRGLLAARDSGHVVLCASLALQEATYRLRSAGFAAAQVEIVDACEAIVKLPYNEKLSYGLDAFAEALLDADRPAEAAVLLGSLEAVRDGPASEYLQCEQRHREIGARVRAKLGAGSHQSLYLRGKTLGLDEALRATTRPGDTSGYQSPEPRSPFKGPVIREVTQPP